MARFIQRQYRREKVHIDALKAYRDLNERARIELLAHGHGSTRALPNAEHAAKMARIEAVAAASYSFIGVADLPMGQLHGAIKFYYLKANATRHVGFTSGPLSVYRIKRADRLLSKIKAMRKAQQELEKGAILAKRS